MFSCLGLTGNASGFSGGAKKIKRCYHPMTRHLSLTEQQQQDCSSYGAGFIKMQAYIFFKKKSTTRQVHLT